MDGTPTNFYDRWLNFWAETEEAKKNARKVIHEEEYVWIETPQDYKIALVAGPENGFRTWGSEITAAEIPVGHHTGKHEHGEEGIYIIDGEGFSVVNDVRYDWAKGSVLWMPFGSKHQHFNTGSIPARYLSLTCLNLEHFAGLGKLDQHEEKGITRVPPEVPISDDGIDAKGRRISVRMEDAPILEFDPEAAAALPSAPASTEAMEVTVENGRYNMPIPGGQRDWSRAYMWGRGGKESGFKNKELEISNSMGDLPGRHGGKHAHMEAFLYIIDGQGHSVVDGEEIHWKKGSLVHVPGPQTVHQHFNSSDEVNAQLRMAPGLRFNFFQSMAAERFPYLVWGGRGSDDDQPREIVRNRPAQT